MLGALSAGRFLGAVALFRVIGVLTKLYKDDTLSSIPKSFAQLIRDFSALLSRGECKHAVDVFQILLTLQDEALQNIFVLAVLKRKPPTLLNQLTTLRESVAAVRAGNSHVTALIKTRVKQLSHARPQASSRQPLANVVGHAAVTRFFHSHSESMTYTGFNGIGHARNFASKHGGNRGSYNTAENTSAIWTPGGRGSSAYVTIEKTSAGFKHLLKKYKNDQKELATLRQLLGDSDGQPAAKRIRIDSNNVIDMT